MYNSLKRQQRMRHPYYRRSVDVTPMVSGRDGPAYSEDNDLAAIEATVRKGDPLYILRTNDGASLDVLLSKTDAFNRCKTIQHRIGNGGHRVRVFERIGTTLTPVSE
jgi:hypothetical protein